ncbi:MAG: hypothetical protein KatS3mg060_1654 [Dehalococcoidia bacterium]|nr:MAG: hypothetical protein KatS3mg060_1654 [Dehalococcoidia bacterium]
MLDWGQIHEIAATGIECGAHSVSHPKLDALPRWQAAAEIRWSKQMLEDRLGRPCLSFAYPFGFYDDAVRRLVRRAGFTSACAVRFCLSGPHDDLFGLRRLKIGPEMTDVKLERYPRIARRRSPAHCRLLEIACVPAGAASDDAARAAVEGEGMPMSVHELRVSVLVCVYTEARWDDMLAAIDSARHQTTPPGEIIIIVDHNPTLFSRLKSALPDLRIIENEEAPGLSGARNSGVRAAACDLVAFLDDDATAAPDWLEQMTKHLADPRVLGVGSRVDPNWVASPPPLVSRRVLLGGWMQLSRHAGPNVGGPKSVRRRDVYSQGGSDRNRWLSHRNRQRREAPNGL